MKVFIIAILVWAPIAAFAGETIVCHDPDSASSMRFIYMQSGSFAGSKQAEAIIIEEVCVSSSPGDLYAYGFRGEEIYKPHSRYPIYRASTADNLYFYYFIID